MITKKINLLLIVITSIGGICYSINPIMDGNFYEVLQCLSIIPVMLVPIILKKIFKLKINLIIEFIYLIFAFFAQFLGTIVDFYHTANNYDKIMHLLSGVVTAFLGLYVLINFRKYDKNSLIFNIIFIISFVLMIAVFWEFFEYFSDSLFNQDAQNVLTTGINDTMNDIIAAFIGSMLFSIMYIYEEKSSNSIIINKFVKG